MGCKATTAVHVCADTLLKVRCIHLDRPVLVLLLYVGQVGGSEQSCCSVELCSCACWIQAAYAHARHSYAVVLPWLDSLLG